MRDIDYKDKLIKQNINKYKKIFKTIDKDKKLFVEKLYTEAAFMEFALSELQDEIKATGTVYEAVNGNGFTVIQENPAQKSYNTTIKNYNATMKILIEHIPTGAMDDDLTLFLKGK